MSLPRENFKNAYPRLGRDGTPYPANPDIALPEAFTQGLAMVRQELASISNHPAFVGYAPTDEVRDNMRASFRPHFLQSCRAATGADVPAWADLGVGPHYGKIPGFPVDTRVVGDDDPALCYFDWLWRKGDGWNAFNDACIAEVRKLFGNRVLTHYEPAVRTPPVRGTGGAVNLLCHWAYPYPEPYNVRYLLAQQKAMGRGRPGMMLGSSIQGISYRSALAPKDVTVTNPPAWLAAHPDVAYLTTPPDLLREALWASFMPRSDMIGTFATWALFDVPARGGRNALGYAFTNAEAFGAVSNVMHAVAIPLGPLFRAVPDRPSAVAVLESRAAAYFTGRILGGWGNVWRHGVMADAAHLQPDVLYEEDLAEGGVPPHVKAVLAPYCEVLTRSAFDALRRFQARGGVIAADGRLPPGLRQDIALQLPDPKLGGEARQAALRTGAAKLKRDLSGVVTPPADSDNPFIVTFVRSAGSADYVFALNDRRTFGDYVGQWGLVPERGMPNAGTVTLPRTAGAVYDLVRHGAVPFRVAKGRTEIPVSYATSDGRLLLVTDRPLGPLAVSVREGRLRVASPDRDLMIPVGVFADVVSPRYGVIRNGTYECPLPKAGGVCVRNLATGESFAWAVAAPSPAFVIAARGLADACAIDVRAPGESAAYAAEELAAYAEKLTGTRPSIGGAAARRVVLAPGDAALGTDGFEIVETNGTLFVRGGTRGILYGVYEILERFGGVGWFASWHEVVPRREALAVPSGFRLRETPAFALREPFWYDANHHPAFAARIRKNGALWNTLPEKFGGAMLPSSHRYRGHTFDLLVPPAEFGKTHPEYFSEVKGRRKTDHSQLCLTNPDVIRLVTERLREQMRREPEAKVFSVAPNDWFDYCECTNCAAVARADGSTSGPYVRFVIAVASALLDEFPDRLIRAGAYQWYRRPPKGDLHYPKNVLSSFAPIECDFAHPIPGSPYCENIDTAADLAGWGRIASGGLRIFDYATAFGDYPHAFPCVRTMRDNLLWYRRNNVRYVINEGDHSGMGGSFAELKAWVGAKLMWNPDRAVAPLVHRFLDGFYGKAAPQVAAYLRELEALPRDPVKQPLLCCQENVFTPTMDDDFLMRSLVTWDAAEAAVRDDPRYLFNVRLGKLSVAYTILRRKCPAVLATTNAQALAEWRPLARWFVDTVGRLPYAVAITEHVKDARETGMFAAWKRLAELGPAAGRGGLAEETAFWFVKDNWVRRQKDPLASGGMAARIAPAYWEWCLQLKAKDVMADLGVRYRVRVRARVDFRPGVPRQGVAFTGGYHNRGGDAKATFQRRFSAAEVGEEYAWYELGEWTPQSDSEGYFWLSLGQFDKRKFDEHPTVSAVWVDQIAFEMVAH